MKAILFPLFLLIVATASASVNPIDLIVQADPTSHTLTLRTTTDVELPTAVKILDARGVVLHDKELAAGDYLNTRFRLSALPPGAYSVQISDVQGQTVQPIVVNPTGITADPSLAVRSFYPRIDLEERVLTINYLNTGGNRIRVRLADGQGNEVVTDRLPATTAVQRTYSLENLPTGTYFLSVSASGNQRHTTSLRLD